MSEFRRLDFRPNFTNPLRMVGVSMWSSTVYILVRHCLALELVLNLICDKTFGYQIDYHVTLSICVCIVEN